MASIANQHSILLRGQQHLSVRQTAALHIKPFQSACIKDSSILRRQVCDVAASHEEVQSRSLVIVATQAGAGGPSRPAKKKVKKLVDINGDVTKDLGNGMFSIKLENGVSVMAHLSGKIRQNRIKIVPGDKVIVELSPYDLTRGRITRRFKAGEIPGADQAPPQAQ